MVKRFCNVRSNKYSHTTNKIMSEINLADQIIKQKTAITRRQTMPNKVNAF